MTVLLREDDVNKLLDIRDSIQLMEELFSYQHLDTPSVQPRRRVATGQGTLNVMFASVPARNVSGLKSYVVTPHGVRFTVLIYDNSSAKLLAMIEANRLGQLRTGAATGVATKYMAREDASTLGLIGAGYQAETQLEAIAEVRDLRRVLVFSRSYERAKDFSQRMSNRTGLDIQPINDLPEVAGCDIVVTATSSQQPVLFGSNLSDGAHINLVGSNWISKAEADLEVLLRSTSVVVDSIESAKIEGGDLALAIDRGLLWWERVFELSDVVTRRFAPRTSDSDITLFKSHGIASEDVIMAHECYLRAIRKGIGEDIELS